MRHYHNKSYQCGVIDRNISKLMPGIGLESTDRYSSLKRLFTAPLMEKSAHLKAKDFSSEILDIK